MVFGQISSSKPFLALLQETDHELIEFALKNLETQIEEYWFEMASSIPLLIEISESESFVPELKQRASLVASQIYFHMGKLSDSVKYALGAGSFLDVTKRTEYTDTIVGACVDLYVSLREKEAEKALVEQEGLDEDAAAAVAGPPSVATGGNEGARQSSMQRYASTTASSYEPSPEVDARVAEVFERLATTWQDDNVAAAKEMIGFCLRARRTDLLTKLLERVALNNASSSSNNKNNNGGAALLTYAFQVSMLHIRDMRFRQEAVRAIADLYARLSSSGGKLNEVFQHAQCLVFLEDTDAIAKLINQLLKDGHASHALQLAFDISESSNQDLLQKIISALDTSSTTTAVGENGEQVAAAAPQASSSRIRDIVDILSGSLTTDLYLKFLFSRCKADQPMFQKMKKLVPAKASVLVSAVMTSGCLTYSGTAHDSFLRDNIGILARLSDWSRYSAAASLGVVHRGHTSEIMNLLKPYLPNRGSVGPLPFQEAGALYALGLATCGNTLKNKYKKESADAVDAVKYLKDALTDFAASEQLVHGASMGLGLAAMGLQDQSLADQLFTSVTSSEAVASEGAAIGIGLVQLGSANELQCEQLLNAAREQHQKEKTIRGLVMGIALTMMRRESLSLSLVDDMARDRDPWIRVGACYVLGLAYAATDSTLAIEKLLKLCVEDAHDEVRRASIMMIGFVCLANLDHCVAMVRPFTDNYSAHVRYGVAMALAIASAGVPNPAVLRLLKRLGDDAVSFVRQGALISQSLVLIQATEQQTAYVKEFRAKIWQIISDQRMDSCTKFGAILAAGLIDAGGRNCTFALHRNGKALLRPIVGMFLFSQYWHWFPHVLPICLALQPTCVVGLNENLAMPQLAMISNAPPEQFAPPPTMLEEKAKDPKAGKGAGLAKLSATAQEEQRKNEKKKNQGKVDADSARPSTAGNNKDATETATGDKKEGDDEKKEKVTSETIQNPARVTKAQLAVLEMVPDQRYVPLRDKLSLGINILIDTKPEQGEDKQLFSVDFSHRSDDVKPPEPFAWP